MIYNITFSYTTILFIVVLMFVFFLKKRVKNIRTQLFSILIICSFLFAFSEAVLYIYVSFGESVVIENLIYKTHWEFCVISFYIFYLYEMYLIRGMDVKNIWKVITYDSVTKIMFYIMIADLIVFAIIPSKPIDLANINIIGNKADVILQGGLTAIFSCLYFYNALRHYKNLSKMEIEGVIICIVDFIVFFILQVSFPAISFIPFAVAIEVFYLYFNAENPDLIMIQEETENKKQVLRKKNASNYLIKSIVEQVNTNLTTVNNITSEIVEIEDYKLFKSRVKELNKTSNDILNLLDNKINISSAITEAVDKVEEYNIKNIPDEIIEKYFESIKNKHIKLIPKINASVPSVLKGNINIIKIILANLLNNAITYIEAGKIMLEINNSGIDNKMVNLRISIRDTGNGISQKNIEKLISENNTNGIAISKSLIEKIGGTLTIESKEDIYTEFQINIQQEIVDSLPIGLYTPPNVGNEEITYTNYNGRKILICDDNKQSITILKENLLKYNFTVDTTQEASNALEMIKKEPNYNIVFIDDMMSEITGSELIKKILEIDPNLCVIIYTANAKIGMKDEYKKLGFKGYLTKPLSRNILDDLIKNNIK